MPIDEEDLEGVERVLLGRDVLRCSCIIFCWADVVAVPADVTCGSSLVAAAAQLLGS